MSGRKIHSECLYHLGIHPYCSATTGTLAAVLLNLRQASGSLPVQEVLHCTQSREGATHAHAHTHAHTRALTHTHTASPWRRTEEKKNHATGQVSRTPRRYGLGGVLGTVGGSLPAPGFEPGATGLQSQSSDH